ncbi:glycogen debranching protein [Pontibacter mangrovi]|uniref:Glycogen-debranching protein n=1 Tax=Pontibacter mangrovi TaxID=2589816 RepID=A0A501W293_9BACT|nr:isoamylase [Pontibacter mangrovi]TPE43388.1 glycogen-debranching protein [Pontibacter mangrovi]
MASWHTIEGSPNPLGVSFIPEEDAFNFTLYSRNATKVKLLLFREGVYETPTSTFDFNPLVHKSQRVWHCRLKRSDMGGATYYGFQVHGCADELSLLCNVDPQKLLLDPYAREVFFPPNFSRSAASRPGTNIGKAPLGYIMLPPYEFDWQGDRMAPHEHDLVIYEMHVRGFTRSPSAGIANEKAGTFAGVVEKIPFLKELGITAVELMPIQQFDPHAGDYWGYLPLNFFSPHKSYAADQSPSGAVVEFKTMVRELHKAGIEVLLDVAFSHTTEEGMIGPTYHLKGIDPSTYYLIQNDPEDPYLNFSGTGNTLRTDHPAVQRMIMDSLRYWVKEMHVDGFRFDLASIFTRRSDGSVGEAPIFSDIATDPDLAQVRLIAEPWDAQGLYQLGRSFPGSTWLQWNSGFRDDVRRFVRGDEGQVAALMQRLYGSDNLFPDDLLHAYHPYQSINYVTSHDGFTLYDLVSYNKKHNMANGHQNQDGFTVNYSWNCGWEGDEAVPEAVLRLRRQQAKNLFLLLMLANGTPMFVAGDEFLQTQGGNNNPYNQDNPTTWLNWDRMGLMQEHFAFAKRAIAFRKRHPSLGRSRFWRDDVKWYGPNGPVDFSAASHTLAYFLSGAALGDKDLYVLVNAFWESIEFKLMEPGPWYRVADTSLPSPHDFLDEQEKEEVKTASYTLQARAVAVLVRDTAQPASSYSI